MLASTAGIVSLPLGRLVTLKTNDPFFFSFKRGKMEKSARQGKVSGRSRGKKPLSFANDYYEQSAEFEHYHKSEETTSKEVADPMVNEHQIYVLTCL